MTSQPSGWRHRTGVLVLLLLSPLLSVVAWAPSADATPACTIYWTGGAGDHAWANTANWSHDRLSNGSDSVDFLPYERDRVCVADHPVSRGAVVGWPNSGGSEAIESIDFPGPDDTLTVNSGLAIQVPGWPSPTQRSVIHGLTVNENATVRIAQPMTILDPVILTGGGMVHAYSPDGQTPTRMLSGVRADVGVLVGDITLLGDSTAKRLFTMEGVVNRRTITLAPGGGVGVLGNEQVTGLVNHGLIVGSGLPDQPWFLSGVHNQAAVRSTAGPMAIGDWSPDLVDGVLSGGTYDIRGGPLQFLRPVTDNRATLRLRDGARTLLWGTELDALSWLAENHGTLDLTHSRVDSTVDLVNSGTVLLRSSTLTTARYTQTAGSTRLQARSRIAADTDISGGSLWGNGFVDGDLTLGPDTTTKVQVRPTGADQLGVSGSASVDGRLEIDNAGSFEPDPSASYRFLTAGSRSGTFASVVGEAMTLRTYDVEYQALGARLVQRPLARLDAVDGGPIAQARTGTLTLHGDGLVAGTVVGFSRPGISVVPGSYTYAGAHTMTVSVRVGPNVKPGPVTVTSTSPAGEGRCDDCLLVSTRPTLSTVDPGSLAAGVVERPLTVTGSGFVEGATVTVRGARVLSTRFLSSTELTVVVSVPASHPTGPVPVTVWNPDGGLFTCPACLSITSPGT